MERSVVCAAAAPPYLRLVEPDGAARPALADDALVGRPRFPAVAAQLLAYAAVTEERGAASWLTALAVVERAGGGILDVLPGAAVHTRAAWAPAGDRLAFVRPDPSSPAAAVVLYDADTGDERTVLEEEAVRAVAWDGPSALLFSAGAAVVRLELDSGVRAQVFRHEVAGFFLEYGTDDYYGTIDELAPGPDGRLALVLAWAQQGKPARRETRVLEGGQLGPPVLEREAWSPRWTQGGELAVATRDAVAVPAGGTPVRVEGLQAFDWA